MREVKIAGCWPSSFFFFFTFLGTGAKSRSIKTQKKKKERGQHPAILTEQAWLIKDLLYGPKIAAKNFAFAGTKREIPSGKIGPSFPLG